LLVAEPALVETNDRGQVRAVEERGSGLEIVAEAEEKFLTN
jgi:hypothetical protein